MQSDPVANAPRARTMHWDRRESGWAHAARAAAPWMLWSIVVWAGVPGTAPDFLQGPLAFSIVLAAMVFFAFRPPWQRALRFVPAIVGTGMMGELVANALTDAG